MSLEMRFSPRKQAQRNDDSRKAERTDRQSIVVNDALSFLIYGTTKAEVKGLDQIPQDQWPTALRCSFTPTTSWLAWERGLR